MAERLQLLENSSIITEVLFKISQRMYSISLIKIRKGNKTSECGSDDVIVKILGPQRFLIATNFA